MSLYVLDTDILTLFQNGHAAVTQRVQQHPYTEIAVCIISVEEQLAGWYTKLRKSKTDPDLARIYGKMTNAVRFLSQLQILSFPEPAIARYRLLRTTHRRIDKSDLRIAAIVLETAGTLVTRNIQDFEQIPG
jgi:tRNA(fMet)-specific endonuclease VapC